MKRIVGPVALIWLILALLMGVELGGAFAGVGGLLLFPAAIMVLLVGFYFMRVQESGRLARFFALAAMFWLLVLLGLGSLDPMTRIDYPVAVTRYP